MASAVLAGGAGSGNGGGAGPSRPPPPPQQAAHDSQDADLAMAYRLAMEEQAGAQGRPPPYQLPPPPPLPLPLPPSAYPPGPRQHDVAMAAALAESQFAARQAVGFEENRKQLYNAAVSQALERSMLTADYDDLLRDIKRWTIDLGAAADEVAAALTGAQRRRQDVAARLEAMDPAADPARAAKLAWQAEQLPLAQARLEALAARMTPVAVAVEDLRELREHVAAASPPRAVAEEKRDAIVAQLFRDMADAGLGGDARGGKARPPTALLARSLALVVCKTLLELFFTRAARVAVIHMRAGAHRRPPVGGRPGGGRAAHPGAAAAAQPGAQQHGRLHHGSGLH
jgi:hypothetical protein